MSRRPRRDLPPPVRFPLDAVDARKTCARKDRYASEAEARAFALMNGTAPALDVYACAVCGAWHLARRNR